MNVLNLILLYWDSIVTVIVILAGLIVLYKKGETKILRAILFRLVTKAERDYGGGTGELKKAAVTEWVYDKMPLVLKMVVTKNELEKLIDDVLDYAKKKWETNPYLQSYISGGPTDTE